MKINNVLVLGIITLIPVAVSAKNNLEEPRTKYYWSPKLGITKFEKVINKNGCSHKSGYGIHVSVGLSQELFDYEIEGIYNNYNHRDIINPNFENAPIPTKQKDGKVNYYSGMLNVYFKAIPNYLISPYVGAGLGVTKPYFKNYIKEDSKIKFNALTSYQLITGFNFNILSDVNLLINYKYFSSFKTLKSSEYNKNLNHLRNQSINLGIKFIF